MQALAAVKYRVVCRNRIKDIIIIKPTVSLNYQLAEINDSLLK